MNEKTRIKRLWKVLILAFFLLSVLGSEYYFHDAKVHAESQRKGKVNINTCTKKELLKKIPSMAPHKAQKIMKGRPYSKLYDLVTKKILTKKELSRVRDLIAVRDP